MIKELTSNEVTSIVGARFLPGLFSLNPLRLAMKILFHVTKTGCDEGETGPDC